MKKIFSYAVLLLCGLCLFTACEDDNDSNPIVQQPTSFQLNTPAFANELIDLAQSDSLYFSWSQPDYGFPVVAAYYLQISMTGNFTTSVDEAEADETGATVADYVSSDDSYNLCARNYNASDIATMLQKLNKWEEDEVPAETTIYVRIWSEIPVSGGVAPSVGGVASNAVALRVKPSYVELSDAPVELWYLVGSCIGDGSWGTTAADLGKSIYPMHEVAGYEYDKKTGQGEIEFSGYLTPDGFKLIKVLGNWDNQWGQGADGYVKNDGGSGNITVPVAGYYKVTLNTKTDELTIDPLDIAPTVYAEMLISGSFNDWGETAMSPVNTAACMAGHNHIWAYTLDAPDAVEVKFLQSGWSPNWGASAFPSGVGENNGANIPVPAGSYVVIFNDIDGTYTFISK